MNRAQADVLAVAPLARALERRGVAPVKLGDIRPYAGSDATDAQIVDALRELTAADPVAAGSALTALNRGRKAARRGPVVGDLVLRRGALFVGGR